jgi:hypothetical protein
VGILLDVIGGVEISLWEGCYPQINIGTNVWGESSIMTGVYEPWCLSTLHIAWGLCDSLCLVLVCRGRYGLGGVDLLLGSNWKKYEGAKDSPRRRAAEDAQTTAEHDVLLWASGL